MCQCALEGDTATVVQQHMLVDLLRLRPYALSKGIPTCLLQELPLRPHVRAHTSRHTTADKLSHHPHFIAHT